MEKKRKNLYSYSIEELKNTFTAFNLHGTPGNIYGSS